MAAFQYLEAQTARHGEVLDWQTLVSFEFEGVRVPLIGASGIWKPAILDIPLSITTRPPVEGQPPPYEDQVREDGVLLYRYQGDDPTNHFNRGLRAAYRDQRPLIYFHGVVKGRYRPFWPAVIVEDHPEDLAVAVALYESDALRPDLDATGIADLTRSYSRQLTLGRLHQAAFRERVLTAYRKACAVCRLKHAELLDAAHILPDSHPRGEPVVPNGLALCKIHHAAFDANILGIRPDCVIEIRLDILEETDGPMLRHGLQDMNGATLLVPRRVELRPEQDRLEERYEAFQQAG